MKFDSTTRGALVDSQQWQLGVVSQGMVIRVTLGSPRPIPPVPVALETVEPSLGVLGCTWYRPLDHFQPMTKLLPVVAGTDKFHQLGLAGVGIDQFLQAGQFI